MCCTYLFWKEYQDEGFFVYFRTLFQGGGVFLFCFFFKTLTILQEKLDGAYHFRSFPQCLFLSLCTLNDVFFSVQCVLGAGSVRFMGDRFFIRPCFLQ